MHVVFAGLSGAGKTAHATALARFLGFRYVSGSRLKNLISLREGMVPDRRHWLWSPAVLAADEARMHDERSDAALETILKKEMESSDDIVFDTWFLAWQLSKSSAFKVYLDVPIGVRVSRIAAELLGGDESREDVLTAVRGKDARARAFGQKAYGVDIASDVEPFDTIISLEREEEWSAVERVVEALAANRLRGQKLRLSVADRIVARRILKKCPHTANVLFL